MTMTITGNEADFDPTVTFTETAPASGDAVTAASLSSNGSTPKTGFQAEANAIEFFREVFRGNLTALKVLFDGTGNATPPTWSGAIPLIGTSANAGGANPALALGMRDTTAGAAQVRFYRGASALYITMNAYWDAASSKWTADAAGVVSYALEVSNSGVVISQKAAGSAPWAVWDGGDISLRDVNATRDVNAGRHVVAANNVSTTSGSVTAGGTVSGNTGPGLLKGKRLYATGTANVGGDFTLSASWGAGASVAVSSGSTDMAGTITVTSNGAGAGANPTVQLTYKDGTFTNAPQVMWSLSGGSGTWAQVAWSSAAASTTVTYVGTPAAAGETYQLTWMVIGN